MTSENVPAAAEGADTVPAQASSPPADLKPPPTDTSWLQVESMRASRDPAEIHFTAKPPPEQKR